MLKEWSLKASSRNKDNINPKLSLASANNLSDKHESKIGILRMKGGEQKR